MKSFNDCEHLDWNKAFVRGKSGLKWYKMECADCGAECDHPDKKRKLINKDCDICPRCGEHSGFEICGDCDEELGSECCGAKQVERSDS